MGRILSVAAAIAIFALSIFALPVTTATPALAKNCGGLNQRACPVLKRGPQCDRGLKKVKGFCRRVAPRPQSCGGLNQRACPALKRGPRCQPGLKRIQGFCRKVATQPQRCGGYNQRACPPLKRGPRCGSGLYNFKGWCKRCGGDKQPACPALKRGPQCNAGLAKIKGWCYRCGGLKQPACPALKRGPSCGPGLYNSKGWCQRCGGDKQPACPALKRGAQCNSGLVNVKGWCHRCGGRDQYACKALARGPRCAGGLTNVKGICRKLNCGGLNQPGCPKNVRLRACNKGLVTFQNRCLRKGPNPAYCGNLNQTTCPMTVRLQPCDKGLQPYNGQCKKPVVCGMPKLPACPKHTGRAPCVKGYAPAPVTKLCELAIVAGAKRTAIDTAKRCYQDFKPMIRPMVKYYWCQKGLGRLGSLKQAIKAKEANKALAVLEAATCKRELDTLISTMKARGFQSMSLGVAGNVNLAVVGGSGEYFVATDLNLERAALYASVSGSLLTPGAEASLNGVVTAFYGNVDQLSGGGKSFSVSAKAFGGAGAAVGLSKGKNPRCTSFSAAAGAGVAVNVGSMSATQTVKLARFRVPKPDFSRGCKDVRIQATNQTGGTIKIVDIDFYDYKQDRWRSKFTSNRAVAPGRVWWWKTKLQKVDGDETRLRIQYRKRNGAGWSKVQNHLTPKFRCQKGTSISASIR